MPKQIASNLSLLCDFKFIWITLVQLHKCRIMNQSTSNEATRPYQEILESTIGIPFFENNKIIPLKNGSKIFPAMLHAIENARHKIDFLTFVYWTGDIAEKFAKALARKAKEGLRVRVILDSYGASIMSRTLIGQMEQSGVKISWFRPIPTWKVWKIDNRTHRKVLICDNKVAFTGGVGIAEEWEGDARNPDEWRETHFQIEGPAVQGLFAAFMENWIETGSKIDLEYPWKNNGSAFNLRAAGDAKIQVLRTSSSVRWSDIVLLYQTLISAARYSIKIATAYFNPDETIAELLATKAREGLDIDIMMPGEYSDARVSQIAGQRTFELLLESGVDLWHYQKTMLHAKIFIVDDLMCCIGSANFNHRSMLKDDEVNLVVLDKDLVASLLRDYGEDLQHCEEIVPKRWKKRSVLRMALEKVSHVFKEQV